MKSDEPQYALGVDLGGSSVKVVTVTFSGRLLARDRADFTAAKPMSWAEEISNRVRAAEIQQGRPAAVIGLSAPGLADRAGRWIAHMPARLQGLEGLDWTAHLKRKRSVPVLNDAHAALLGEAWLGAARGLKNVVMLTLGTGVGGAAMVDGRLLRGELGRAGHLGHISLDPMGPPDICRTPGSLEWSVGNCSIVRRTRGRFQSTHSLVEASLGGDADAQRVWMKSLKHLAAGLCSLVNVLDPAVIVIGGGIARAAGAFFEPLRDEFDRVEWRIGTHRVRIVPAELGELAGGYGAAFRAIADSAGVNPDVQ